ncbi:hypothetical protein C2I36_14590 [Rhodobacteraceae bacterium WD3A24]|nr:hypothetical protein C2I36_14590 [Rhodobacteraceae bacterium WD3A24]
MRVVQISDLHLSREYPLFLHNWQTVARLIDELAPDLVLATGDLALAEPDRADDLAFAARSLAMLDRPVLSLPGNHDIGEGAPGDLAPTGEQKPVTSERVGRFRKLVGPDYWSHHAGGWRFVGINSQLFGTGLPEEEAQNAFIANELGRADAPPTILVTHKPLFSEPQGCARPGRAIPQAHSAWLRRLLTRAGVGHVLSGHMHRYKAYVDAGITHVWAPSTAFISTHASHADRGGEAVLGLLCHDIDAHGVTTRFVDDCRLITSDIRNWALPRGNALWTIVTEPSPITAVDSGGGFDVDPDRDARADYSGLRPGRER